MFFAVYLNKSYLRLVFKAYLNIVGTTPAAIFLLKIDFLLSTLIPKNLERIECGQLVRFFNLT